MESGCHDSRVVVATHPNSISGGPASPSMNDQRIEKEVNKNFDESLNKYAKSITFKCWGRIILR